MLWVQKEVSILGRDLRAGPWRANPGHQCLGLGPAVGEPWADNGLIKERVQAGRSWAWLPQEENVRN